MNNWYKFFTSANVFVYKVTGGRIGNKLGKQSILILDTIGRKSGKKLSTTLSYYRDGEQYLLVGSNWGKETHPGWFYNLKRHPQATIQVNRMIIQVEAHPAEGDEYQRLWQLVVKQNDQYIRYQVNMHRKIPIIVLTPIHSH